MLTTYKMTDSLNCCIMVHNQCYVDLMKKVKRVLYQHLLVSNTPQKLYSSRNTSFQMSVSCCHGKPSSLKLRQCFQWHMWKQYKLMFYTLAKCKTKKWMHYIIWTESDYCINSSYIYIWSSWLLLLTGSSYWLRHLINYEYFSDYV